MDRARPERLGELARHVVREYPDADVLMEAPALASLPEGSTAILCVRAADADWLNQERPVVQSRSLRLVLFSDEETTLHLARRAVDFYDWISHRIDCPEGPPAYAARALRQWACARAPAIGWHGGGLEACLARALPGRTIERISAAQPYAALVEALRPRPRTWAVVTDLDRMSRARRSLWAAAEASRMGRLVLMEPPDGLPEVPQVCGQALTLEEGAGRLREAGVQQSVRLSALLELDPGAIDAAAKLSRAGMTGAELVEIVLPEADPGAALARALARKDVAAEESKPEGSISEGRRSFRLPDWPGRVELAMQAGDLEVAEHWANGWRAASGGSVRATAALVRIRLLKGKLAEARALLDEVLRQTKEAPDDETRFEVLRAEGLLLWSEGHPVRSLRLLNEALELARCLGRSNEEVGELYDIVVQGLIEVGRLKDAERKFDECVTLMRRAMGAQRLDLFLARPAASLMLARGEIEAASRMLESVLDRWPDPEHPSRDPLVQILARAWIQQERYREAEQLTRAAIERLERLGREVTFLRHEHGRALLGLGLLRESEKELRWVLRGAPDSKSATPTRHELARCLVAQGRLDEAEVLLDETLTELQREGIAQGAQYATSLYEKARIRRLRGDLPKAVALFHEVLRLEERVFGREHPTLLLTLRELGTALAALGRSHEAEPLFRRAVRLAEQTGSRLLLAEQFRNLAIAQAAQGFAHARDTARRALQTWNEAGEELPPAFRRQLEAIAAGSAPRSPAPPRRKRR